MALIKCPECGKENVSDSAQACPNCGFAINEHFQKIKNEQEKIEKEKQAAEQKKKLEIETKEKEVQKVKSIPKPDKPKYSILAAICGILCIFLGGHSVISYDEYDITRSVSHGNGDPVFQGWLLLIGGFIIIGIGFYFYFKKVKDYKFAESNFEEYQKETFKRQNAVSTYQQNGLPQRINIKCPTCGSTNVEKISGASKAGKVALFGVLAAGSVSKTFHCKNCGYKW